LRTILETIMENALISPAPENVDWTPMPDPIRKEEVDIQLAWTVDARTELAIRRQANLMGFETLARLPQPRDHRGDASNETNTIIASKGSLAPGPLCACDGIGISQDV
jgi:hypothetical protein